MKRTIQINSQLYAATCLTQLIVVLCFAGTAFSHTGTQVWHDLRLQILKQEQAKTAIREENTAGTDFRKGIELINIKKEEQFRAASPAFGARAPHDTALLYKMPSDKISKSETGSFVPASEKLGHYRLPTAVDINVRGKVVDAEKNEPLPGVSVFVKGTQIGTATDADGLFAINVPDEKAVLVFSSVGFIAQEIPVGTRSVIDVTLTADNKTLEEIVVVGYGTQKKENLSGSVAVVSAKQLEARPVTNVASALQGTMPGVTVVQNNGQPGRDQPTIRVRGIGTLGNSDAMVLVDGVVGTMNDVNPNDIETLTVLKDAASAAIYGSRASNGVILITTRKGKSGAPAIRYNTYIGVQAPTSLPEYLSSAEAAGFYNEALANEGQNPRYTQAEIELFRNGSDPDNYPNTDWLDLFYSGSGLQHNHYIDISSGTEKSQNLISLGYFSQEGIVKNTGLDRYTARFKNTSHISARFKVNTSLAYTLERFKEPSNPRGRGFGAFFWEINRIGRNVPYKHSNGYYGYYDGGNPMAMLEVGGLTTTNTHFFRGILDADLEIVKGLHFRPLVGYNLDVRQENEFRKSIQYYNWQTGEPTVFHGPNYSRAGSNFNSVITLQSLLSYTKNWGKHDFYVLGGYSQEYTNTNFLQGSRINFLNNSLSDLNAGPVTGQQNSNSSAEIALQSLFGRVNYAFDNKYLLEANIRYDGSSRFAEENRWGLYPSFSGAWRLSEEMFFTPLENVINEFKIRASWGMLGNQNIGSYYPYIATIATGQNYTFGGAIANGIAPANGANTRIQWEKTTSTNIGFDAGFLNGSIAFTADYFIRNTTDMLLSIPVGNVYGFNAPVQNGGSIQNRGFELGLGYNSSYKDFTYNVMANASFITNELTDLKDTDPIIYSYTFLKVGYPINSFYGYEAEGIFQTQEEVDAHATQSGGVIAPGDLKYKDQNGDNVINGEDRVYLGTYFPKVTYGLNAAFGFKGFDLTLFLQGAAGVKGFLQGEIMGMTGDKIGKPTSIFRDRWTAESPNNNFPRFWNTYTQNNPNNHPSSFWIRNAGYMRLKNLQLGYTLAANWLQKVGVQKARLYYSGQNILTFTQFYKWVDPEAPAGETGYTHPQVKVNSIGLNLTF